VVLSSKDQDESHYIWLGKLGVHLPLKFLLYLQHGKLPLFVSPLGWALALCRMSELCGY
jgi:hypothetical protein